MTRLLFTRLAVGCLAACLLAVSGCSVESAHMQDLRDRVLHSYTTSTPNHLYYIGSDGQYDYYYLTKEDKRYKVSQTESVRQSRMDLTSDRTLWVVVTPSAPMDGAPLP